MIQAGTIRTGSGRTVAVAGAYWMSSIRRVAIDDLAGRHRDIAADLEILGCRRACLPLTARSQSSRKFCQPSTRLTPPLREGAAENFRIGQRGNSTAPTMSRICRAANSTIFSCCLRHAADAGGGVVPPLLLQQKGLVMKLIRPVAPSLARQSACPAAAARCSPARAPGRRSARHKRRSAPPCASPFPTEAAGGPARARDASPNRNKRREERPATRQP